MKETVEMIARAIVDEPDVVSVTEVSGAHSSILELKVAKTDIGQGHRQPGPGKGTQVSAGPARHQRRPGPQIPGAHRRQ